MATRFEEFRANATERFVNISTHIADLQRVKDEAVKESAADRANYITVASYEREHKALQAAVFEIRTGQAKSVGAREVLTIIAVLVAAIIGAITSHMMSTVMR